MEVAMVFKLTYDAEKESVSQFREKYMQLREHVDRLQLKGVLPRGTIKFSVERKQPRPPDGPARVCGFRPPHGAYVPVLAHEAGTRLDVNRIAV